MTGTPGAARRFRPRVAVVVGAGVGQHGLGMRLLQHVVEVGENQGWVKAKLGWRIATRGAGPVRQFQPAECLGGAGNAERTLQRVHGPSQRRRHEAAECQTEFARNRLERSRKTPGSRGRNISWRPHTCSEGCHNCHIRVLGKSLACGPRRFGANSQGQVDANAVSFCPASARAARKLRNSGPTCRYSQEPGLMQSYRWSRDHVHVLLVLPPV